MHTYEDHQQTQREVQDRYKAAKEKLGGVQRVVADAIAARPATTDAEEVKRLRQAIQQVGEIVR